MAFVQHSSEQLVPHKDTVNSLCAAVIKYMSSPQSLATNKGQSVNYSPELIAQVCRQLSSINGVDNGNGAAPSTPNHCRTPSRTPSICSSASDAMSTPIYRSSSICSSASDASTPLDRSSSISSASSMASSASSYSQNDMSLHYAEDGQQQGFRKKRKRRRQDPIKRADAIVVTRPVMEKFDPLLSKKNSPTLFRRRFKRQPNPDGSRSLKKYPEIVMPTFKQLVRPVLRQILSSSRHSEADTASLYRRYFNAALRIVKKRRANHVQSWRLNNRPLPLVYTITAASQRPQHVEESQQPQHAEESQQPQHAEESQQPQHVEESQQPHVEESQQSSVEESQQSQHVEESQQSQHVEESQQRHVEDWQNADEDSTSTDPDMDPDPTFVCNRCDERFPLTELYPKDKWRGGSGRRVTACRKCWEIHLRTQVLPHIQNEAEREKQLDRLKQGPQKRKSTAEPTATAVSKKKSRTTNKCKWCGATDHKTKRSKKCPYSKNYKPSQPSESPTAQPSESTTAQPSGKPADFDVSEETDKKSEEDVREACKKMVMDGAKSRRTRPIFEVGSNVIAKWKRKEWFLAHVTDNQNGKYDVYFPGDGKRKSGLPPSDVREVNASSKVYMRRDMLGRSFYFEGEEDLRPGTWVVRRMINKRNVYVCVRTTGGTSSSKNCEEFDI